MKITLSYWLMQSKFLLRLPFYSYTHSVVQLAIKSAKKNAEPTARKLPLINVGTTIISSRRVFVTGQETKEVARQQTVTRSRTGKRSALSEMN